MVEKRDYTKTAQTEDMTVTDSMMLPHELVDTDLPNHPYAVCTDNPIYDYYKPDKKTALTVPTSYNNHIYYPPGYEKLTYRLGLCKKKHHSKKSIRTKMKKASRRRNRK